MKFGNYLTNQTICFLEKTRFRSMGAVLRRNVIPFANESSPLQFMEWFNNRIISALDQDEDLNTNQRVFFLSGRAGQGKSTLVRHMFLHLKNQEYYDENLPRLRPNYTREIDRNLSNFSINIGILPNSIKPEILQVKPNRLIFRAEHL